MSFERKNPDRPDITALLRDRLLLVPVGETISFADLSASVAHTDCGPIRGASWQLQAALDQCLRRHQTKFRNARGRGYERLTDSAIVNDCTRDRMRHIRSTARAGIAEQKAISDFAALSHREQMRSSAVQSLYGMVAYLTREKQIEQTETRISNQDQPRVLPVAQIIRIFSKGS